MTGASDAQRFTEESIEQGIEHAINESHDTEAVIQKPIYFSRNLISELVDEENPIWQTTHDEHRHEDENYFKHSHLSTLTSVASSFDIGRSI